MPNNNIKFPEWESWLRINAEVHFLEGRERYAWREVGEAHNPNKTLSKQIAVYYQSLPAEQKELFTNGLVECLLNLPQEEEYFEVFLVFIQLTIECHCLKIIKSPFFEKIVFRGKLGYLNQENINRDENTACIFRLIVTVLRYFSKFGTGEEVARLAKKMVGSDFFPKKHIYLLFLILCKAQPNKLVSNWKTVRKKHFLFLKELAPEKRNPDSYPNLRSELDTILDLDDIAKFSVEIKLFEDYCEDDEWLIQILNNKTNGPLKIKCKNNVISFIKPEGQAFINDHLSDKRLGEGFYNHMKNKYNLNKMLSIENFSEHQLIANFYKMEYAFNKNNTLQEEININSESMLWPIISGRTNYPQNDEHR